MSWEKFLVMVKDNGITTENPSELSTRVLRKFWKKFHKDSIKLSVMAAILVNSLISCEVW